MVVVVVVVVVVVPLLFGAPHIHRCHLLSCSTHIHNTTQTQHDTQRHTHLQRRLGQQVEAVQLPVQALRHRDRRHADVPMDHAAVVVQERDRRRHVQDAGREVLVAVAPLEAELAQHEGQRPHRLGHEEDGRAAGLAVGRLERVAVRQDVGVAQLRMGAMGGSGSGGGR